MSESEGCDEVYEWGSASSFDGIVEEDYEVLGLLVCLSLWYLAVSELS